MTRLAAQHLYEGESPRLTMRDLRQEKRDLPLRGVVEHRNMIDMEPDQH